MPLPSVRLVDQLDPRRSAPPPYTPEVETAVRIWNTIYASLTESATRSPTSVDHVDAVVGDRALFRRSAPALRPAMIDLPEPDSPTRPMASPVSTLSVTSLRF